MDKGLSGTRSTAETKRGSNSSHQSSSFLSGREAHGNLGSLLPEQSLQVAMFWPRALHSSLVKQSCWGAWWTGSSRCCPVSVEAALSRMSPACELHTMGACVPAEFLPSTGLLYQAALTPWYAAKTFSENCTVG